MANAQCTRAQAVRVWSNTMLTVYEERGLDLDLDPNNITSIMNQVNCTRAQAVKALRNNDSNLFLTIMELTTPTTETAEEKEENDIPPLSTANSQFWGDYYNTVYERDFFADKSEERTLPLKGKYHNDETTNTMAAERILPVTDEWEKKESRRHDDFLNLYETSKRQSLVPPIKKLYPKSK
jgi:hypothetical protein